jgi:hypothetical protein
MEVQTRSSKGELKFFETIKEAFDHARDDSTVYKVSFGVESGERVRLVYRNGSWVYEDLMEITRGILAKRGIDIKGR